MRYVSTRDVNSPARYFSFIDAVLEGLAPDGGLLVPEQVPIIEECVIESMRDFTYQELCFAILRKFMSSDEVTDAELRTMISSAYTATFEAADVAPIVQVGPLNVMELFHGPTFAFKDVALQLLGQLVDFALRKWSARMTILGATSGDTGSAAIASVKGRDNIDCVILFPLGKTSKIQELQMTSNLEKNIHCLAVHDSVFDDCQNIVKACFNDQQFNNEMSLGAVNSINWARILAQIVYYAFASLRFPESPSFIVPTGNFGNVLAAYYAQQMGFPINNLVVASNMNDILPKFFETGEYVIAPKVMPTMSPSMDIGISSNFERFLFDLWQRQSEVVVEKFNQLKSERKFQISPAQLETARYVFKSFRVDEIRTLDTISDVFKRFNYLLCPHSAVGYAAGLNYLESEEYQGEPVVTLATAHIGKFTDQILANIAGHRNPELRKAVIASVPARLKRLDGVETRRIDIANSVEDVKLYLRQHRS